MYKKHEIIGHFVCRQLSIILIIIINNRSTIKQLTIYRFVPITNKSITILKGMFTIVLFNFYRILISDIYNNNVLIKNK